MMTPWIPVSTPHHNKAAACKSQMGTSQTYRECLLEEGLALWDATCPAGYQFSLAPDAVTDPYTWVRITWPSPTEFPRPNPYWWSDSQLHVVQQYYDDWDTGISSKTPDGYTGPVPAGPHVWGSPQPYLCTKGAAAAARSVSARAAGEGQTDHVKLVRHLVRTVEIPKHDRLVTVRLHCPVGEKLLDSSSTIGIFSAKRPTARDHRRLRLKHLEMRGHARIDARAHHRLSNATQVKVQLRVSCQAR